MKITREKKYQTWAGWKRAAKEAGATRFEGDKDIAQAFGVVDPSRSPSDRSNLFAVGEWDGVEGSVYTYETAREMPGMHDDFPTRNPRTSRDTIRVGDEVIGIMGVDGGYAGVVTDVAWDSRGRTLVTYRDAQSGEERATFAFNLSKNVPARGVFPRKNPLRRLPGESERDFMARCMSAEKKKFPRQDQRVAVCLSKARRNPAPSHWFFVDSENLRIHTQGRGNHPTTTYTYESEEDFMNAIRRFERDGYEFIKDQAPTPRITKTRRNPLESGAQSPNATLTNRRAASMT